MLNQIAISGNVTSEPELRELPDGTPTARLRIAHTDRRQEAGQWVNRDTTFLDVIVYRALALNIAASLHTGMPVDVTGTLHRG